MRLLSQALSSIFSRHFQIHWCDLSFTRYCLAMPSMKIRGKDPHSSVSMTVHNVSLLSASSCHSYPSPSFGAPVFDTSTRDNADKSISAKAASHSKWPKGWRPWLCLFGCFLLMFNSWGLVNAYGTFASYYKQHLLPGTDLLLWNLVGSTESFIVLALSFVVGRLVDANYSRHLIVLGALLLTLGMFLLSTVNGSGTRDEGNYGLTWFTQGFVVGLGMSCFFVSSSQVAATWFIYTKAIAIGIVASGASVGKCFAYGLILQPPWLIFHF